MSGTLVGGKLIIARAPRPLSVCPRTCGAAVPLARSGAAQLCATAWGNPRIDSLRAMGSRGEDAAAPLQAASACRIQRQFVQLEPPGASGTGASFRVLQWNLLADGLAQHGDFVRAKPEVLEWAYRKPLILAEVLEAQADILCFQELNYYDELAAELAGRGYQGSFLAKQRSAALKYSSPADGIAIFWRTDRFLASGDAKGFHFIDSNGGQYPQGCMHVLLTDRRSGGSGGAARQVLVVTTHLKAKEGVDLEQIRLQQVQQLLGHVRDAATAATGGGNGTSPASAASGNSSHPPPVLPLVVAGDFNTVPQSLPCQVLASPPWNLQSIWNIPAVEATSSLEEESEPSAGQNGGGGDEALQGTCPVPEFSTWKFRSTGESKRVIDHVWFRPGAGGLRITRRWRMPSEREIGPDGLPCGVYPSDHLALCAEFDWL